MAGILNHTIADFIEKKTSDDVKKLCWQFSFKLHYKIYNFSQHDDRNGCTLSIYIYKYRL